MDFTQAVTLENSSYLWGALILSPIWIYTYIKRRDSRKELLICSILFGLVSIPIGYLYATHDYWNPPYIFNNILHLEDFIYGFLFGGISSEIYELAFGYRDRRKHKRNYKLAIVFSIISGITFLIVVNVLKLNSIIAHIIPPIIAGLSSMLLRKDLVKPAIISGALMVIITFLWQNIILMIYPNAITDFWMLEKLSGIILVGIPIEELLFAFSLGFGASTFYELIMGYQYYKRK